MAQQVNSTQEGRDREVKVSLSRDLKLFDITMIGVGGMIGAGIFVLTGIAAGLAGPGLILAFSLNGLVTLFTAMAYAELGSAFPEAGGGYLWVKEALGGAQGFLSGWMSWFAHSVAGSLYALGFGRFAAELWVMAGLPEFGLSEEALIGYVTLGLMTLAILTFTAINYRGASETGTVGNIITMTKVFILALFVLFGILAMVRTEAWHARFSTGFLPNGLLGVFQAMGLTFIAFEGYEIISQSGEEVQDPKRTIPRAIFLAIAIAVVIYILVGTVVIGAVRPPAGVPAYRYLGELKEVAVVDVAQDVFPLGIGALVLIFSGLISTMSALNATTYSSSRVSFAMGRDLNLPAVFARIHPLRHTPYWAVVISGSLMLIMAWTLPIEQVAAAADVMFLFLFLQVNVSVMVLRQKMPDLDRGFVIPWYPLVPVLGFLSQGLLAAFLFTYSPIAFLLGLGWNVVGLLAYYAYFSRVEAMERPSEILHEEVLVSTDYSVMVPIASEEQARILGQIGAIIARDRGGEVLAAHVARVPPQLTLADGRYFLREGRQYLETLIAEARKLEVPVHTVIRLGRNVPEALRKTAVENASDLIVFGWPGYTNTAGRLFGSVIDPLVDNPPTDIALVRYRHRRPVRSILVPVSAGPNSRRAVKLAISMARQAEEGPARVHVMTVIPYQAPPNVRVRAQQAIDYALESTRNYSEHITTDLVEGQDIAEVIVQAAREDHDLVVMGATEEPVFRNLLTGNIPAQVATNSPVTVIIVKRRSGLIRSMLRQTVLPPTTGQLAVSRPAQGDEEAGSGEGM
jgi:amino acid transporter/nucleotide-binding universal stress UspA family protein